MESIRDNAIGRGIRGSIRDGRRILRKQAAGLF